MTEQATVTKAPPQHESIEPSVRVTTMGSCSRSAWECFILFGAGRIDEFRTMAKKAKERNLHSGYTMLLGIARIDGDKSAFEDVAVDYAMQFGQSPPSWHEAHSRTNRTTESVIEVAVASFSSDTIIETVVKMDMPRPIRLDLSQVKQVDNAGMDLFNEALASRIARGLKTRIVNGDRFVDDLELRLGASTAKLAKASWEFCFSYYRINGLRQHFERAAKKYASLGGEPPQWQDLSEPAQDPQASQAAGNGFMAPARLVGLDAAAARALLASEAGARARREGTLVVDMVNTTSGSIFNAMDAAEFFSQLRQAGVRVQLLNVNEIFVAMFEALSIDHLVESICVPGTSS